MPTVSIYIPDIQFQKIDLYAKEKGMSVSRLMTLSTLAVANKAKQVKCEMCHNPAIGQFRVTTYDWNNGEGIKEIFLCQNHKQKAQSEGEVKEI